jgi:hypothetical protein
MLSAKHTAQSMKETTINIIDGLQGQQVQLKRLLAQKVIIEAHGGRLWATRCEPRGALFQFTISANWGLTDESPENLVQR